MSDLKEKLDYEYECFTLDMMRTSKDNIFASSKEIEIKKAIYRYFLKIFPQMKEQEIREFSAESNLLEAVYNQMECDFPERAVSEVLVVAGIHKLRKSGG